MRGLPAHMVSDNGKTFKAAARILRKVVTSTEVSKHFRGAKVKWTFNVRHQVIMSSKSYRLGCHD